MIKTWKEILKLALPSIATFSSMTFTGMLSLILIGKLGAASIAVVGISNIVMYNFWAAISGIGNTLNYLVAQNFGENNLEEGNLRTQLLLVTSSVLSLLLLGLSFLLPGVILQWLGANVAIRTIGTPYLQIRIVAFCFSIMTNVFFAYMRGVGDTKTPMYISLLSNVLLLFFTYSWTYGHFGFRKLGLNGAAWSMVISEGAALFLSLMVHYVIYHKKFHTRVWYRTSWDQLKFLLTESVKLSGMELSMSLGMLIFTGCITRLGTVAVAANEIALNILSLGFMPANGFAAAATIAVGQEVGRGKPYEARRVGLHTVLLGTIFMALFSIFLFLFALPTSKIYTDDPQVYLLAVSLIHIVSFVQLFDGAGLIVGGGLRGIGDTTYLFRMSLLVNWVIFIPLTLLLTIVWHFGQAGAWIALSTLIVFIGCANLARYLTIRWALVTTSSAG